MRLFFFFFFFLLFTATPAECESSQARGQITAAATAIPAACSNARSLTHWVRPGVKLASSEIQGWVLNLLSHNGNSQVLSADVYIFSHYLVITLLLWTMIYWIFGMCCALFVFNKSLSFLWGQEPCLLYFCPQSRQNALHIIKVGYGPMSMRLSQWW